MNRTVLIVDDDRDIRQLLDRALRKHGFETLVTGSGEEALALFRKHTIHAAIIDLVLGGMDGLTLAEIVSEEFPDVRLLAITGFCDALDHEETYAAGFSAVFPKPCDLNSLITAMTSETPALAAC